MKKRWWVFIKYGIIGLALLGLACSAIPWGNPQGVHGEGWPIPNVLWEPKNRYPGYEHLPDSDMMDFVNPLAVLINPVVFVVFGGVLMSLFEMIRCVCVCLGRLRSSE